MLACVLVYELYASVGVKIAKENSIRLRFQQKIRIMTFEALTWGTNMVWDSLLWDNKLLPMIRKHSTQANARGSSAKPGIDFR